MKHINNYNKFLELNEDIEIKGNIDEYDTDLIKDGLVDLTDLGWKITNIDKISYDSIHIKLMIKTERIVEGILCRYYFNNTEFYDNYEKVKLYSGNTIDYDPSKYERDIINTIKNYSQTILNMLEYSKGRIDFFYMAQMISYIEIRLNKNNETLI